MIVVNSLFVDKFHRDNRGVTREVEALHPNREKSYTEDAYIIIINMCLL